MNEEESRAKEPDATRASSPDPAEAEDSDGKRRKRPRLTLRIPDDDVKREPAKTEVDAEPIAAAPIIPLGEVTGPDADRLRASSRPPPALEPVSRPPSVPPLPSEPDDKTPLMPTVIEAEPARAASPSEDGIEVALDEAAHDEDEAIPLSASDATDATEEPSLTDAAPTQPILEPSQPSQPSQPPPAPKISAQPSQPKVAVAPASEPQLKHLSEPPRARAAAIVDDAEAVSAAPDERVESDRESTLPLDAEDLVSIEAVPSPPKVPAGLTAQSKITQVEGQRAPSQTAAPTSARAPLVIVPSHATTPSPLAPQSVSAESTGSRRRGRPWWEDMFNDDFIRTMAKVTDEQIAREVDFIEDSLGVARGGALMDLACGTGRHAIELSRRGYQVVGYDLSLAMLARAADEAQDREQKLNFVHGDMREMNFDETFDGVYCWNTSFGFFEEEKNAQVIARVHRSLRTGGQFLLDVINRDHVAQQTPSLVWFEGDACICMDEMVLDFITSRMKVKRTMMLDDGRTREIDYSIRIYSLHELGKLLHDHGFRVAEVSGNCATPGVYFGGTSPRTLILAEKR